MFSWSLCWQAHTFVCVTTSAALVSVLLGLGTGLSLIIAIGAQNAYVLRLGIEGRNRIVLGVVLVCALSDALLILAGVLGIGAVIEAAPVALVVIRILGSGFLLVYGVLAAVRVFRPRALVVSGDPPQLGMGSAVATAVAFTWLNPHVYLDTVVLLGSVANQQGADERWWWSAGAIGGSFLWFFALGFGARLLRPVFARPAAWRVLDALIALVMLALGLRLALGD
jgi:L-lysine exporter family protein LysE/ArgO